MSLCAKREIKSTLAGILLGIQHFIKRCRGRDGVTTRKQTQSSLKSPKNMCLSSVWASMCGLEQIILRDRERFLSQSGHSGLKAQFRAVSGRSEDEHRAKTPQNTANKACISMQFNSIFRLQELMCCNSFPKITQPLLNKNVFSYKENKSCNAISVCDVCVSSTNNNNPNKLKTQTSDLERDESKRELLRWRPSPVSFPADSCVNANRQLSRTPLFLRVPFKARWFSPGV